MIRVDNLRLTYGKANILNDVSFTIRKGAMLGLVGPNGAGKSSLIKVLAGLVYPVKGTVFLNDTEIEFADLRKVTGFMIDSPAFYPYLSGIQNLNLIKRINRSEYDLLEMLEKVGLSQTGKKKVKAYSTGMKQRLAIAAALLRSPDLLILDEPFNGLDPGGYRDLWTLLNELNQQGVTIVVSSHLLADLEEYSTDFLLINHGKVALDISKKKLETADRQVSFFFVEKPTSKYMSVFSPYEVVDNDSYVSVSMKSKDIANLVKQLVDQGTPPVNIKTETILQQTFFNLSR
jgi:ABC-2 type transport system ATP-binding protein